MAFCLWSLPWLQGRKSLLFLLVPELVDHASWVALSCDNWKGCELWGQTNVSSMPSRIPWLAPRRHSGGASSRSSRLVDTHQTMYHPRTSVHIIVSAQNAESLPRQRPSPNFTCQVKSYIISLKCSLVFCLEVSHLASHPSCTLGILSTSFFSMEPFRLVWWLVPIQLVE